jgi:hypothetical protein
MGLKIGTRSADSIGVAALLRIEALPGDGRYAVTFERADGSEQAAIMQITEDGVDVAEASLPAGWTRESAAFVATANAVRAFHDARTSASAGPALRDVEGGWDVSLGNVTLNESDTPTCVAHGEMSKIGHEYVCPECGARAVLI